MENGQMLDVEPLSKVSKACKKKLLKSSKPLAINPGAFCVAGVRKADRLCVTKSNYKAEEKNKVQRKVITGRNKRKGDKNEVEEGKTYAAGSFQIHFDVIYLFKCHLFVFKSYRATLSSIFSK
jgi:hypothetical protein